MMQIPATKPAAITLHYPMGEMTVMIDYESDDNGFRHKSAGLVRTPQAGWGDLFVPADIWDGAD